MNYRELQTALKQFRVEGLVDKNFKLNQKKTILLAEYARVTRTAVSTEKVTDEDEVTLLKRRITELEQENAQLKAELDTLKSPETEMSFDDELKIEEAREHLTRGVTVLGDIKGGILDCLTEGTPERVQAERDYLETQLSLDESEYEVIECENGEVSNPVSEIADLADLTDLAESTTIAIEDDIADMNIDDEGDFYFNVK